MSLSIGRVLSEALGELRENGRTLIVALAAPAIGIALLWVWSEHRSSGAGVFFLLVLPQVFLYALFAVTCHRVILLGRERLPNALGVYASKEVWQYTGAMLTFTIIGLMAAMLIALFLVPILELFGPGMGQVVGLGMLAVLGILAIAAVSRVILLFPALAIGAGRSLSDILEMSRPTWLRLAVLIFVSIVLTTLVSWPLTWLMDLSGSTIAAVIPAFLSTLTGAYGVAVISCAYRARVQHGETTQQAF